MDNSILTALSVNTLSCIQGCRASLDVASSFELIVTRLESLLLAVTTVNDINPFPWAVPVIERLELAISLLTNEIERNSIPHSGRMGRPSIEIPISSLEYLLSLKFNVPSIAQFYGVSKNTVFRRLHANGLSVSI